MKTGQIMSWLTAAAVVVLGSFLGATPVSAASPTASKCDYLISVPSNQKLGIIPLTFPLPTADRPVKVYVGADRALILNAATVDGKSLLEKATVTRLHFYGPETVSVRSETHTYLVPVHEGLAFIPRQFESSDGEFATLRFPQEWSEIELRYKIRFPDKTFTRELVMRITRIQMD